MLSGKNPEKKFYLSCEQEKNANFKKKERKKLSKTNIARKMKKYF